MSSLFAAVHYEPELEDAVMKRCVYIWMAMLTVCSVFLNVMPGKAGAAEGSAGYSLSADKSSYKRNEPVVVSINGTGMSDVYGMEAVLTFETELVEFVRVVQENGKASGYTSPEAGKITAYNLKLGETAGTTGNGSIMQLEFRVIKEGSGSFKLVSIKSVDSQTRSATWDKGNSLSIAVDSGDTPDSGENTDEETSSNTPAPSTGTDIPARTELRQSEGGLIAVSHFDKKKLLEQLTAAGAKAVISLTVSSQPGATGYGAMLPASVLSESRGDYSIQLITPMGTVTLPGKMLADTSLKTDQVELRLSSVDLSPLPESVRRSIGSRPAINLELYDGDTAIHWSNPATAVTVRFHYTPTGDELLHPERIAVLYAADSTRIETIPNGRYDPATGTIVFTVNHFSTFAVTFGEMPFRDLANYNWAEAAIGAMSARSVVQGTAEGRYEPEQSIKRADFVLMLMRAMELNNDRGGAGFSGDEAHFADVPQDSYYYEAVAKAAQLGIVQGTNDSQFQPDEPVTRQDVMVLIDRTLEVKQPGWSTAAGSLAAFTDQSTIAPYAQGSVARLVQAGVVEGNNGAIHPMKDLTRAEAAVLLMRVLFRGN